MEAEVCHRAEREVIRNFVAPCPEKYLAGGRVYHAVIGACAEEGKLSAVLIFNAADSTALGQGFDVVVPGTI
jgi:hypothetical protein